MHALITATNRISITISTTDQPILIQGLVTTFRLAFIPVIVVRLGEERPLSGDKPYKLTIDIEWGVLPAIVFCVPGSSTSPFFSRSTPCRRPTGTSFERGHEPEPEVEDSVTPLST